MVTSKTFPKRARESDSMVLYVLEFQTEIIWNLKWSSSTFWATSSAVTFCFFNSIMSEDKASGFNFSTESITRKYFAMLSLTMSGENKKEKNSK